MPFLIRNTKPNKQAIEVRAKGISHHLAFGEQIVLNIRNITSEMFHQTTRNEITTLYVSRMPVVNPAAAVTLPTGAVNTVAPLAAASAAPLTASPILAAPALAVLPVASTPTIRAAI